MAPVIVPEENQTEDIKDKVTIVDDTLLWSDDTRQNFMDVCEMLSTCHDAGLIFNSDKFQFGHETVEFAGLGVTMHTGPKCLRKRSL